MATKIDKVMELQFQLTGTEIAFCYGNKAYSKYMKEQFNLEEHIPMGGCSTIVTKENEFRIVIGIQEIKNKYQRNGMLIHELSHTVSQLMEEFDLRCDEVRSYTLQWMYQCITESLDKRIKRDKKRCSKAN